MKEPVIAIVPAAGSARRFGMGLNKTFFEILGKPIIQWTVEVFVDSPLITEIITVFSASDLEQGKQILAGLASDKIRRAVVGGAERQDSVFNALKSIDRQESWVIIHDGARPLVDTAMIKRCLSPLDRFDGTVTAISLKDTIKEAQDGKVLRTLDRSLLYSVQTPQAFRYATLYNAYEKVLAEGVVFTDDASVVEAAGGSIAIVEGSEMNIKVTTPDDAVIAETFLRRRTGD